MTGNRPAADLPVRVEFLGVRSYGTGTDSSGVVQITQDLSRPIEGEDVLFVEDIVDTGLTIAHLLDLMRTRLPRSAAPTRCLAMRRSRTARSGSRTARAGSQP